MDFNSKVNISTKPLTTATAGLNGHHFGFILVLLTATLGSVACVLGIIYTYIYCAKIKPKIQPAKQVKIGHYDRCGHFGQYAGERDNQEPLSIKTHPFIIASPGTRIKLAG